METFLPMLGFVVPLVGAIMLLTVFFKLIGWAGRRSAGDVGRLAFKGVMNERTPVTVHLVNGKTLDDVRLLGMTEPGSDKWPAPFELRGMAVLEFADGRRLLLRAKLIKMIEIPSGPA